MFCDKWISKRERHTKLLHKNETFDKPIEKLNTKLFENLIESIKVNKREFLKKEEIIEHNQPKLLLIWFDSDFQFCPKQMYIFTDEIIVFLINKKLLFGLNFGKKRILFDLHFVL